MDRSTILTAIATAGTCAALLLVQNGRNRSLASALAADEEAVEELERRAAHPELAAGGAVSALEGPGAPMPGSIEAAVAEARANTTPEQRIANAVERIEALVADIGDMSNSPAELFKVLPDLLRMVQDLDLDEMIAVADALDAPLAMGGDMDGRGAMKFILMMLAADQDPGRILDHPDVKGQGQIEAMVIASLARRDAFAAKERMEDLELPHYMKTRIEQMVVLQMLRDDFASGLAMLRESEDGDSRGALAMIGQFGLPDDLLPQVIDSLDEPENAELRPHLLGIVMSSTIADGGVDAARERAAELDLSDQEIGAMINNHLQALVATDADAAFDWLAEVQTPEQYAETLPEAIRTWARSDYNAAGGWLGRQPPSPARDSAIGNYSNMIAEIDPEAATVWAAEIGDEELRRSSIRYAANRWQQADADAANAWLADRGISLPETGADAPAEAPEPPDR